MRLRRTAVLAVVRILTEDYHFDIVRARETQGAEYIGGVHRLAGGTLTVNESAQRCVSVAVREWSQMRAPCGRQHVELGLERGR
jgi:hypothetical protein